MPVAHESMVRRSARRIPGGWIARSIYMTAVALILSLAVVYVLDNEKIVSSLLVLIPVIGAVIVGDIIREFWSRRKRAKKTHVPAGPSLQVRWMPSPTTRTSAPTLRRPVKRRRYLRHQTGRTELWVWINKHQMGARPSSSRPLLHVEPGRTHMPPSPTSCRHSVGNTLGGRHRR